MRPGPSLLVLLAALLLAVPARADVHMEMRYGHGGQVIYGATTPVVVRIENKETVGLEVVIGSSSGSGASGYQATGFVSPGAVKEFLLHLRPSSGWNPPVTVRFDRKVRAVLAGEQVQVGREIEFPVDLRSSNGASSVHLLAVGSRASLLPRGVDGVRVHPVEEEHLAEYWFAYDGVDVVYWRNPGEERALDPARVRELLRWVSGGGRLVVAAPARPDLLRASPLAAYLPALPADPLPNADYLGLARALKGSEATALDGAVPQTGPLTPLLSPSGSALPGAPIRREARHGLGSISVLAFDPARFADTRRGLATGLHLALLGRDEGGGKGRSLEEHIGSPDTYTCYPEIRDYPAAIRGYILQGAQKPPPIALLSFFLVLYILAIGPLDYFALKSKRLLRYSALTFLGIAVAFSLVAWFVSFYLFAGATRVNRVTIVDVVPGSDAEDLDRLFVHDLASYYAPRGWSVALPFSSDGFCVDTLQLPAQSVGASLDALGGSTLAADQTRPGRPSARLRVPFRSVRTSRLVACRETTWPLDVIRTPNGGVEVRSGLTFDLEDVTLVNRDHRMVIGRVPAGGTVRSDRTMQPRRDGIYEHHCGTEPLPNARAMRDGAAPREFSRALLSVSAAELLDSWQEPTVEGHGLRILRKWGLERSEHLRRGGMLLLAWTDARDPLGLPGADEEGFTLTLIRKVIEP